jgi:hypothetical protein
MKQTFETFLATILIIAFITILLGFPLMWLWNWLMPMIFNLPEITFWQALGVNALSSILFKSSITTKKD